MYGGILISLEVHYGMGSHVQYIPSTLSGFLEIITITIISVCIGACLVKFSICFFILCLIKEIHPRTQFTLHSQGTLSLARLPCFKLHSNVVH